MALINLPLGSFFEAAAAPIAKKVLSGLGLGIITFGVIVTTVNALIAQAMTYYTGITGFTAALLGLAGFGEAFGIISAAMVFKATLAAGKTIGFLS